MTDIELIYAACHEVAAHSAGDKALLSEDGSPLARLLQRLNDGYAVANERDEAMRVINLLLQELGDVAIPGTCEEDAVTYAKAFLANHAETTTDPKPALSLEQRCAAAVHFISSCTSDNTPAAYRRAILWRFNVTEAEVSAYINKRGHELISKLEMLCSHRR